MTPHKPIHTVSPTDYWECLSTYNVYDYSIQYKPEKDMILADLLSRFPSEKEN